MINSEREYEVTKIKFEKGLKFIEETRKRMEKAGMSSEHIKLGIEPLLSFNLQLKEELEEFDSKWPKNGRKCNKDY